MSLAGSSTVAFVMNQNWLAVVSNAAPSERSLRWSVVPYWKPTRVRLTLGS